MALVILAASPPVILAEGGDPVGRNSRRGRGSTTESTRRIHRRTNTIANTSNRRTPHVKSPTVYILASKPRGVLYVGVTSNLARRVGQHREGLVKGFTKRYNVKILVWYEQHPTMLGAIAREKALKKRLRAHKLDLIAARNREWRDLWLDITESSTCAARASDTPTT